MGEKTNNPGAPSYLINWGMEIVQDRYLRGLGNHEKHTFAECWHKE